jgi:hypothetical protein
VVDKKRDGCHPVHSQPSKDGQAVASRKKFNAATLALTSVRGPGGTQPPTDYSIVASNTPHPCDPLEEALQRLDAAYDDAVNMAIAHNVFAHIMTEEEGRLLFEEQRQVWQEARL